MNYEQCLRYLEGIQNLGIKFGLDNVRTVLSSFNNPHQKFASVLVAGTNGKGSVCAMLAQILILSITFMLVSLPPPILSESKRGLKSAINLYQLEASAGGLQSSGRGLTS
jgi:hypothetical protein